MTRDSAIRSADWYFDFISPYAYFQFHRFEQLPAALRVTCKPVLFAGLLGHWGHKGPAEIPAKRLHTYRYCKWHADRLGLPFTMPPAHPFNPLPPLRLAIVCGASRAAVGTIFDAIWGEGLDLSAGEGWALLCQRLGLDADGRGAAHRSAGGQGRAARQHRRGAGARGVRRADLRDRRRAVLGRRRDRYVSRLSRPA